MENIKDAKQAIEVEAEAKRHNNNYTRIVIGNGKTEEVILLPYRDFQVKTKTKTTKRRRLTPYVKTTYTCSSVSPTVIHSVGNSDFKVRASRTTKLTYVEDGEGLNCINNS